MWLQAKPHECCWLHQLGRSIYARVDNSLSNCPTDEFSHSGRSTSRQSKVSFGAERTHVQSKSFRTNVSTILLNIIVSLVARDGAHPKFRSIKVCNKIDLLSSGCEVEKTAVAIKSNSNEARALFRYGVDDLCKLLKIS